MSSELTRKAVPARRRFARRNTMAFPRELRAAIPDLYAGRVLELDSINGRSSNTLLFGPLVELKLVVKETGKLSGEFVVRMSLQVDAARTCFSFLTNPGNLLERDYWTTPFARNSPGTPVKGRRYGRCSASFT